MKPATRATSKAASKGIAEGVEKVLSVLDEEARKDAERKLNLNGNPNSKD